MIKPRAPQIIIRIRIIIISLHQKQEEDEDNGSYDEHNQSGLKLLGRVSELEDSLFWLFRDFFANKNIGAK